MYHPKYPAATEVVPDVYRADIFLERQHVSDDRADSRAAAAEPVRSRGRADVQRVQALPNQIPLDEMNPGLAGLRGLQRELAEFSMTIDTSQPDSAPADILNRAIWHSVKAFDTPYNYGRPILQRHTSFESLLPLTGR